MEVALAMIAARGRMEAELRLLRRWPSAAFEREFPIPDGVPEEVTKRLKGSKRFAAMVKAIAGVYVSLDQLMSSGQPGDLDDSGRLTRGKFRLRRVLLIQTGPTSDFRRARTVDNTGTADILDIGTPGPFSGPSADKLLVQAWIGRILCMLAEVHQVAIEKAPPKNLAERIKWRIKNQIEARKGVDVALREIDAADKSFGIGTLFVGDFILPRFVEISFYPVDFLLDASRLLTNLEHWTLLERLEIARRAAGLGPAAIDELKAQIDAVPLGDEADLAKQLVGPGPTVFDRRAGKDVTLTSDLARLYFRRRVADRRWRLLEPRKHDLKADKAVIERRREHAAALFDKTVTYLSS